MARMVDKWLPRKGAGVPNQGHGRAQREPILPRVGETCLLAERPGQIRERVSEREPVTLRHPTGKRHRLEDHPGQHIEMLEGEAEQVPDLVIIYAPDDGGEKTLI